MDKILLNRLLERLPELEWKINSLNGSLTANSLPRGLFSAKNLNAINCIAEIKDNIVRLEKQETGLSACYLAERIQQKISVLVKLCNLQAKKPRVTERMHFAVDKLSTRQQWLQSLEEEITRLSAQQKALTKALTQLKNKEETTAALNLQAELGGLEKRLTLAKEARSSL